MSNEVKGLSAAEVVQERRDILLGGREIEVELWAPGAGPGTGNGETVKDSVKVKKVAFTRLETYLRAFGQTERELAFYTDRDEKWLARLTDESAMAIWELGRQLNAPFLQRYLERMEETLGVVGRLSGNPLVKELLKTVSASK